NAKVLIDNLENYAKNYKFFDYCMELYHFVWNVFCDWYIEFTKFYNYEDFKDTLEKVLKVILLYLHPLIPFSTFYLYENIFGSIITGQRFKNIKEELCLYKSDFEIVQNLIDSVKEVRPFVNEILSLNSNQVGIEIVDNLDYEIKKLFYHFTKSTECKGENKKYFTLSTKIGKIKIFVEQSFIDQYKKLVSKKIEEYTRNIEKIEKLLNNEEFVKKADPQVVENYKQNLTKYKEMININKGILLEI
ncbi:MAG: class I tRNA ligase family protein, partial [bacterium]